MDFLLTTYSYFMVIGPIYKKLEKILNIRTNFYHMRSLLDKSLTCMEYILVSSSA